MNGKSRAGLVGLIALVSGVATAGCVSYANYPPVPQDTAYNDPNTPAMEEVMEAGLRWMRNKHLADPTAPAAGGAQPAKYAVNLPKGVKPSVYRRVAAALGPDARPLTPETSHLPIFHVDMIRVRGDQANLWLYRPAPEMGLAPNGMPIYQEVKLWFRGGLQPWRVINAIERTPSAGEVPELNYYEPEKPQEMRESARPEGTYKPAPKPKPEQAPAAAQPAGEPAQPAPEPAAPAANEPPK